MTKSGFESDTVKKLINIVTIAPLVIAGLYSSVAIYDFIFPPSKEKSESVVDYLKRSGSTMFSGLFSLLFTLFNYISIVFSYIWKFITHFRFSMITLFILYLVFCYFLSKNYQYSPFLNDWSNYINIVLILIASGFIISIFSLFVKENNENNAFPESGIKNKIAWTFNESLPVYKSLLGISISLGLVFITFYILKFFKFLSQTINSFLIVLAIIGLIFSLFTIISKNVKLMTKIESSNIFKLIYHTIFLIPCLVVYFTNFIWSEINDTPKITWLILLVQIILIGGYFLIPVLKKWLFTNSVSKSDDLFLQQESLAHDRSIIANEQKLSSMMNKMSVDWDYIISNNLYDKNEEIALKEYLMSRGYVSVKNKQRVNFLEKMFKPDLTLEAGISYVQANTLVIIDLKKQIYMQLKESKNLSKTHKERDNMFKTKILLNKPIYLSKKKVLGSYESIGSSVGAFNYNYAISAWVFLHNQDPSLRSSSNKFTTILDYASKPKIQFKPSENKLRIIMMNGIDKENVVYETKNVKLQRWNNILINYNGGTLDIFINGKLKSTTQNIVPVMSYDGISVGEDGGLSGGICNVVYFPDPVPLSKIQLYYKSLKYKNPPIL